jgi:hypothetical protein
VLDVLGAELVIGGVGRSAVIPERPIGRLDRSGSSTCRAATTAVLAGISEAEDDRDWIRGTTDSFVCWRDQPSVHSTRN